MEENKEAVEPKRVIDLGEIFGIIWKKKKVFFIMWVAVFILSCVYILPQPRTYLTSTVMAPETSATSVSGSLAGIASSFGINLDGAQNDDAIYPELYPDLIGTNEFAVNMLYTTVQTKEGEKMTYLDYIRKRHKMNPYLIPIEWMKKKISAMTEGENAAGKIGTKRLNPYRLNRKQAGIVAMVQKNIQCDVDVKTQIITISVSEQDPMVAVQLADTTRVRLQNYITEYRTRKARTDADYYKRLLDNAKKEYDKSIAKYSAYCDANQDVILQSYISKRDELENDMSSKMTEYNAINTQYTMAKAEVQKRTPAFTVLSEAAMPFKPSGPKRMVFVAAMLILSTIILSVYYLRDFFFRG